MNPGKAGGYFLSRPLFTDSGTLEISHDVAATLAIQKHEPFGLFLVAPQGGLWGICGVSGIRLVRV